MGDSASLFFVIAERSGDAAAGFVQIRKMDFIHGHGELGIALTRETQGKGYAVAEAVWVMEGHARSVFGLRKVVLHVRVSNSRAIIPAYERCGYARVGILQQHFRHDGAYHDVLAMEHLLEGVA